MGLRVGVAGAGVAGLAAAAFLARAGHGVTVIDRFAAPAPVGSGLMIQPVGRAVLAALGCEAALLARAAPITRLFGRAVPSGRVVLDVRYRPGVVGLGVQRGALFAILLDAARAAGVELVTGATLSGHRAGRLIGPGGEWGPYDLIVDACGARSPLSGHPAPPLAYGALWGLLDWPEGFDAGALEQRYRRASRMVGVLPVGRAAPGAAPKATFFWSLRGADLPAWRAAGLAAWRAEVAALWREAAPLARAITEPGQLTFAQYAHRTLRQPIGPGIAHLGDSYHAASPQLGQGANLALLDAAALAAALAGPGGVAAGLARYARLRRRHVWIYQTLSALFTPAYQSDSRVMPVLRDLMMAPMSRVWPVPGILAALVGGTLGAPLRGLALDRLSAACCRDGAAAAVGRP